MPYKTCPRCNITCGVRTIICKSCKFVFQTAKCTKKKCCKSTIPQVKWNQLQPGDVIKVIIGSGPYFKTEEDNIYMGEHGTFKVKDIDDKGIHAFPNKVGRYRHCYIYMGPKEISKYGTHLAPHKIKRIKKCIQQ